MNVRFKALIVILAALAFKEAVAIGQSKGEQRIEVTASRFSFKPNEITVKKGEPVTIVITSKDVTHGLLIEGLGVRTEVKKGQTEEVTFTPETTGTYDGKCAHFCGEGHASMTFTVHVVE